MKNMELNEFQGKKICVAVSGGADSMSLLTYLKEREKSSGYFLCAVTCEHGIRGEESVADMRLVEEYCKALDVELFIFRQDCVKRAKDEKKSLETACRDFRREAFEKIVNTGKADYIATAHHLNDEAETVLFRLCRGTSLSGLKGIEEKNGYFIRPFIKKSKAEILEYAEKNNVPYHNDKTNFENDATRNIIRNVVLPQLENAVSGSTENIAKFAFTAQEDDKFLYSLAEKYVEKTVPEFLGDTGVRVSFIKDKPLLFRAIIQAIKLSGVEKDYTAKQVENVAELFSLQTGSKADVVFGLKAQNVYGKIAFYYERETEERIYGFSCGEFEFENKTVCITKTEPKDTPYLKVDEKVLKNSVIRLAKQGDEIEKFGGGRKTLKKYLTDKKILANIRKDIPVIAKDNEVLVVCGVEISNKSKITENTENTVYISVKIPTNEGDK